jgi:hypothetical protein
MNTFSWQTEGVTARSDAPASSAKDERSNAEKQAVVVDFLRSRVGSAALSARQIAAALSEGGAPPVDLRVETAVDAMVRANARVRVQFDEEMEAHYEYQAKHEDVHDAASLVTFVNNSPNGVVASEVFDCYVGAERDVEKAIVGGAVVATLDATTRRVGLFPRGAPYLVRLTGDAKPKDARTVATAKDVTTEVRRGDAVGLVLDDGADPPVAWHRVSSRVHASGSQPKRAERPLGATSLKEMHSANEYCDRFDAGALTVNEDRLDCGGRPRFGLCRHGASNDVRALWLETAAETPVDHAQLERKLVEAKLNAKISRKSNKRPGRKQEDEAKKKRRVNSRFQRLTNTHLVGTPIGDVLAAAFNADPAADGATGGTRFKGS